MPLKVLGKQKYKQKDSLTLSTIKTFGFGTLWGLIVYFIGLFLVSLILLKSQSEAETIYYALYIFIGLGAFTSAIFIQKRVGGRGFITGILSSFPYILVLLASTAIILGFGITGKIIVLLPICLISGFLGGITAVNTK